MSPLPGGCAADVDIPVDAVAYQPNTFPIVEHHYQKEDLREISNWRQEHLRAVTGDPPGDWLEIASSKLRPSPDGKPGAS